MLASPDTLLGDAVLLTGDVLNWVSGRSGPVVTYVLDARFPRVLAALLAGAALAVAGAAVQAVCRNPLAEPGILGVTGGAGIGAVLVITIAPLAGIWWLTGAAGVGAVIACVLVFGLAAKGGLSSDRLVLIGVGVSAGAAAVITFIVVLTDPWNSIKAPDLAFRFDLRAHAAPGGAGGRRATARCPLAGALP